MLRRKIFGVSFVVLGLGLLAASLCLADGELRGAVYSVPVPEALSSQATLPMKVDEWRAVNGSQVLKYQIPEDLVGDEPIEETLIGPQPKFGTPFTELVGEKAVASCAASEDKVICLVRYKANQPFSTPQGQEKTTRFLRTKFSGSAQLADKINVAMFFSNEPAGVVTFFLTP